MEKWQSDHISLNLCELLNSTICSDHLLTILLSKDILGEGDTQLINSSATPYSKATALYAILKTRRNSYLNLIQALQITRQTGAERILRSKYSEEYYEDGVIVCNEKPEHRLSEPSRTKYCVYKGTFGLRQVAVKRQFHEFQVKSNENDFRNHIDILTKVDCHNNIARYFSSKIVDVQDNFIDVQFAFELCDYDLQDWILSGRNQGRNRFEYQIDIIKQITCGMTFLHNIQRVAHLNLKPSSILLNDRHGNIHVKIANFSNAKIIASPEQTTLIRSNKIRSYDWIPREVIRQKSKQPRQPVSVGFSTDIFALGCIYYFVVSNGVHPFGEQFERTGHIIKGKLGIDFERYLSHECLRNGCDTIIRKMVAHEASNRSRIQDVLTSLDTRCE